MTDTPYQAAQSPVIREWGPTLFSVALAVLVVVVSVSSFAMSVPFGVGATFVISAVTALVLPMSAPAILIGAFLLQNMVVAWYSPYITDTDSFDALRGANFVVMASIFVMFLAAAMQPRYRDNPDIRRWILIGVGLGAIIMLYVGLGMVAGDPRDAIIYFRNIIIPIACFYIALVAATSWTVDIRRLVAVFATIAVVYGYLELTFTLDFLSLFHGDDYVRINSWKMIQSGVWEKTLEETGYVLLGLEDSLTTNAFNIEFFSNFLPRVFRIGGPNFHPIAYAYALTIFSAWLIFAGRYVLPAFAFPLMLIVGSKGALFIFVVAVLARVVAATLGPRLAVVTAVALSVLWASVSIVIGGRSDYHVLGLFAGIRDFFSNPLGHGIGLGGNLSSTTLNLNWQDAQANGVAAIALESTLGVLMYQMGIAFLAIYAFLFAIGRAAWTGLRRSGDPALLFLIVALVALSANSVLQEEAFFSPLALGLLLVLGGLSLGRSFRLQR